MKIYEETKICSCGRKVKSTEILKGIFAFDGCWDCKKIVCDDCVVRIGKFYKCKECSKK